MKQTANRKNVISIVFSIGPFCIVLFLFNMLILFTVMCSFILLFYSSLFVRLQSSAIGHTFCSRTPFSDFDDCADCADGTVWPWGRRFTRVLLFPVCFLLHPHILSSTTPLKWGPHTLIVCLFLFLTCDIVLHHYQQPSHVAGFCASLTSSDANSKLHSLKN